MFQTGETFECPTVDTQRVFEPRMNGTWVDQCNKPKLADPGQPPHLSRVEERPHAGCQRHRDSGGDPHALRVGFECHEFR
jgi:hypothetical protein